MFSKKIKFFALLIIFQTSFDSLAKNNSAVQNLDNLYPQMFLRSGVFKLSLFNASYFGRNVPGTFDRDSFDKPGGSAPSCYEIDWTTWSSISSESATGSLTHGGQNINVSLKSNFQFESAPEISRFESFKRYKSPIPNTTVPRTQWTRSGVGTVTISFSKPVKEPVLLLASLGSYKEKVFTTLTFSEPYVVYFYSYGMLFDTNTKLTGREGYALIKFPGDVQSITISTAVSPDFAELTLGVPVCPEGLPKPAAAPLDSPPVLVAKPEIQKPEPVKAVEVLKPALPVVAATPEPKPRPVEAPKTIEQPKPAPALAANKTEPVKAVEVLKSAPPVVATAPEPKPKAVEASKTIEQPKPAPVLAANKPEPVKTVEAPMPAPPVLAAAPEPKPKAVEAPKTIEQPKPAPALAVSKPEAVKPLEAPKPALPVVAAAPEPKPKAVEAPKTVEQPKPTPALVASKPESVKAEEVLKPAPPVVAAAPEPKPKPVEAPKTIEQPKPAPALAASKPEPVKAVEVLKPASPVVAAAPEPKPKPVEAPKTIEQPKPAPALVASKPEPVKTLETPKPASPVVAAAPELKPKLVEAPKTIEQPKPAPVLAANKPEPAKAVETPKPTLIKPAPKLIKSPGNILANQQPQIASTKHLNIEVWDYDGMDYDSIAIKLNGKLIGPDAIQLPLQTRNGAPDYTFPLLLQPAGENTLEIVALSEGVKAFTSVGLLIMYEDKPRKLYFRLRAKESTIVKL